MQLSNARYVRVPGWYDITVTPDDGEPFDYTVAPHDDAPMAVAIRAAVAAQSIPIAPYADPALTLDGARAAKLKAIEAQIRAQLAAGVPFGGLHIALDDGSRADMTAMGTTAIAAAAGSIPWPEDYARGWIAMENVRIALSTPADGLGLAATVGAHYAALRQHGRDLKDLAGAAETVGDLDEIDVTAGWPD